MAAVCVTKFEDVRGNVEQEAATKHGTVMAAVIQERVDVVGMICFSPETVRL